MRRDYKTRAIVLSRINYGESDRIVTLLTEDFGKVKVIVKGVRNQKSKLAASVELFSLSVIIFRPGKRDIARLITAELKVFFDGILIDLERVQTGYQLLRILNRATEDETDQEFFLVMLQALESLNDPRIDLSIVVCWFYSRLLVLSGHQPNLLTLSSGQKLDIKHSYDFDFENFTFYSSANTNIYSANEIKFLRLMFSVNNPLILQQVEGVSDLIIKLLPMVQTMFSSYIRI